MLTRACVKLGPVVFVLACEDDKFPAYFTQHSRDQVREEARLLYVAMTRAQAHLTLTWSSHRTSGYQKQMKRLSPFICGGEIAGLKCKDVRHYLDDSQREVPLDLPWLQMSAKIVGREVPPEEKVEECTKA